MALVWCSFSYGCCYLDQPPSSSFYISGDVRKCTSLVPCALKPLPLLTNKGVASLSHILYGTNEGIHHNLPNKMY